MEKIKIAIVDDHQLVSKALENMISFNENYEVIMNCSNGQEFLDDLQNSPHLPEVVLMDINMPVKNGIETTEAVSERYPSVKVIALTMEDNGSVSKLGGKLKILFLLDGKYRCNFKTFTS